MPSSTIRKEVKMEIFRPLNYIPDGISPQDYRFDKKLFRNLTRSKRSKIFGLLPKEIDHTQNMSPVKDQEQLGSCVSFATVALKEWQEWQEFLKIKDQHNIEENIYSDLSEQWVYHHAKRIDNIQNEGTTIRAALSVLRKFGVPQEKSWVYSDRIKGTPEGDADTKARFTRIGDFFRLQNKVNHLKLALLHTPVPIGVVTTESFMKTRDGIIEDDVRNRGKHGGHAICAVGYDNKKKLIKFKNSWSAQWGDNGYGYLSYNYFKKYCIVAWAINDIQVPVEYLKEIT